jgi:prolyl oligopeptidase PreP (S9A serine peptidase family)
MRDSSAPPVARVDVVREEPFGVPLADPYRWMEAEDEELAGWLSGQGSYAASRLAGLPGRAAFRARVAELTATATADSVFSLAGDRLFFQRQAYDATVPVLMMTEGRTTRVLLDPAALTGQEHSHLDWFAPSPDGTRPEAFFTLSSWIHAPRLYRYDGVTVGDTGWLPPSAADFSGIVVSDLRVPARDGTLIPLRVVHKAGLILDGSSPAILSGYGSYAVLSFWGFVPEMLAWYERGGIYADAGLRGGGEYGREWHEAGSGPRKENTITDFIDCAEYLVDRGYTRPGRLAGQGASAGGVPVGGALVRGQAAADDAAIFFLAFRLTKLFSLDET